MSTFYNELFSKREHDVTLNKKIVDTEVKK